MRRQAGGNGSGRVPSGVASDKPHSSIDAFINQGQPETCCAGYSISMRISKMFAQDAQHSSQGFGRSPQ